MSRYIPVAAKRRALSIYRDRRRGGGYALNPRPLLPLDAMRSTVEFFAGHYAERMAFGDVTNAARLLDGYRAARFYQDRLYRKPWRWSRPVRSYAEIEHTVG